MPIVSGMYSQSAVWSGTAVASGGTAADPTSDATGALGMDISDCTGWRVVVSADAGQTLSGAGTVRVWMWSTSLARWVHNSQLDYAVSPTAATWRDDVSPDFAAYVGYGRVYLQLVGVTSSAGSVTPHAEGGALNRSGG